MADAISPETFLARNDTYANRFPRCDMETDPATSENLKEFLPEVRNVDSGDGRSISVFLLPGVSTSE